MKKLNQKVKEVLVNNIYNGEVPVSTIISSVLPFKVFCAQAEGYEANENAVWTSANKWAPCDGRSVSGSNYALLANDDNVPDMRGVFTRCANSLDAEYDRRHPKDPNTLNPDERGVGIYQSDAFKRHNHRVASENARGQIGGGPYDCIQNTQGLHIDEALVESTGGNETRPKNISLYYYIRIN